MGGNAQDHTYILFFVFSSEFAMFEIRFWKKKKRKKKKKKRKKMKNKIIKEKVLLVEQFTL